MEKQIRYYLKGQEPVEYAFDPAYLIVTDQISVGQLAFDTGCICIAVCGEEISLEGFYPWAELLVEDLTGLTEELLERTWCHGKGLPWRVADGSRIYLQELTPSAVPDLYRIYHEPEVRAWVQEMNGTLEEECQRMAEYQHHAYRFYDCGIWGVYRKEDGCLLGSCGLEWKEWNGEVVLELGYVLSAEFRGYGYAAEAAALALEYAGEQEYGVVHARIAPENRPSQAVAERIGMKPVGQRKLDDREYLIYRT